MDEETKEEVVSTPEQPEQPAEAAEAPSADGAAAVAKSPYKGFWGKIDNYFGISKSGSKFKTEIVAGLTTFMAMVYILIVNPSMFGYNLDAFSVP